MIVEYKMKKEFTPVELNITIESVDELKSLWHRMNIGHLPDYYEYEGNLTIDWQLWEALDQIVETYGIEIKTKEGF